MPLETDLSVSPYFDDYQETKDFYKVLFRPGVAVQVRELNQLQTILQTQIERFGDNIFKRGTIIDGCNFQYHTSYPYIKILDTQKNGITANPSAYLGYFLKSANNEIGVKAFVINYQDGFESTDPDLKTLYINYINSGNNGATNTFNSGEVLNVYDPDYPIFNVLANNGGVGFSNTDTLVFVSALVVNVSSGTFTVGDDVYQESTGANVKIVSIDSTTLASANQKILVVKPQTNQLTTTSINATAWSVSNAEAIRNGSSTVTATVEDIIGVGAEGFITTDSVGKVIDVVLTSQGSGYTTLPYVTIKSDQNAAGLSTLKLDPENYLANVQIAAVSQSVGNGYAFAVSEGIIYQKGYFVRVAPQTIIVEKYSQSPNSVVVGFDTREEIVDSNIDTSLLDNSLGTENENAPGANRMQLIPELVLMDSDTAAANDNFFVLTEWSEGRPFKQNRLTSYNKINDEMARRTLEESGDYSLNKFLVTTKSPANTRFEGNTFSVVVDPGLAYIDGYRVETFTNYSFDVQKGNDVATLKNQKITLDYDNYIRINEVGGLFQFSTGDEVKLYDAPKGFISNTTASKTGNTQPETTATQIGTARMRSMIHYDGIPGSANAEYKLYLFHIDMNPGKNFRNVKSVHYNGLYSNGIADVVTSLDATLNTNVAVLEGKSRNRLLFPAGVYSLKNSSNNQYTYRTIDQTLIIANTTGRIVKDISGIVNEYYPYSANVADSDLKDIYLVPTTNSITAMLSMTGTGVSVNTTSANVVGSGTSFSSEFQSGDWIKISNGSSNSIHKIISITNNTLLKVDSNCSFTNNTSTFIYRHFPKNVPIALGSRTPGQTGHSANVDVNGNILTIQFKHANGTNMAFDNPSNCALGVNIERYNVVPTTKEATRKVFVKICVANNATGPQKSHAAATGSVAVTASSNAIVGTGTLFTSEFSVGQTVELSTVIEAGLVSPNPNDKWINKKYYTIGSITDDTHMTFTTVVPAVVANKGTEHYVRRVGNLTGPWCLGVPDVFRLRGVYVGNSSVTNSSPNAVDNFYVDHNHNENFADLSFLYKKPSSSLRIGADDYLLVEFDYGKASGGGFFNTVSYTGSSDKDVVANNDGLGLSQLTTQYNSFEVPEIYTNKGRYWDLLNTFDFRPVAEKSVTPNTAYENAPLNPSYILSFGDTTNPSNDNKFPVPQSIFRTTVHHYLGRIDSVFVDRESNIFSIKGQPSVNPNTALLAETPRYAMRLNNLVIKPYPNVPKTMSPTFARILNRRVGNEILSHKRIKDRIIEPILTQREIEIEQPTGYTMADIGNIARRVTDLEYYVSLSLLESDLKDRVIPSSRDPALNRFKYGFFVDDFSTTLYSDVDNPAYAASIESDDIIPEREIFTKTIEVPPISCEYIDYAVVSQDNATTSAVNPPKNCTPNTISTNTWFVVKENTNKGTVKGKEEISKAKIQMASVSANVTLYAHFYGGADMIQIYQGNTLILQSNSASILTDADKTKMKSKAVPSGWFNGIKFENFSLKADDRGEAIRNSFKISWVHNPANGRNYTVKVTKYSNIWRYAIEYPINSNTVSCGTTPGNKDPNVVTITPNTTVIYNGTMIVDPKKLDIKLLR